MGFLSVKIESYGRAALMKICSLGRFILPPLQEEAAPRRQAIQPAACRLCLRLPVHRFLPGRHALLASPPLGLFQFHNGDAGLALSVIAQPVAFYRGVAF